MYGINISMTKSEIIKKLSYHKTNIPIKIIEDVVKKILEQMSIVLIQGGRIEIRGFGSFSSHYRFPRIGRNPKTGDKVYLSGKYVPHFKPGKALRERANTHHN